MTDTDSLRDDGSSGGIDAVLEAVVEPLVDRDRWVIGQLGQSLDGRIATESGHSHYINGPEDIRRLHRLRALADAVIVGSGTVASDDPRLTVRKVRGSNPVRVVLDARDRLPHDRRVFHSAEAETLWLVDADAAPRDLPGKLAAERIGVETGPEGRFDPGDVLSLLSGRGLGRILVEGGGLTVSSFLEADRLDRLHLSVAPLLIGSGRPGITLPRVETLREARRPRVRHFRLGQDLLFDLDLRTEHPPSS